MGRMRFQRHNLPLKSFVQVKLASATSAASSESFILAQIPIDVHLDMYVDRSLDVETGEDGLHLHHAVPVGGIHSSQTGGLIGVLVYDSNLIVGFIDVELLKGFKEGCIGRQHSRAGIRSSGVTIRC